jgi:excinuclease ABC subunit A
LAFESPDRVSVRDRRSTDSWAEVETKTPKSVRVTLAGPVDAIDLSMLQKLGIDGPVDLADLERTTITLNLTEFKHVRSRNLKSFLKRHWERSTSNANVT